MQCEVCGCTIPGRSFNVVIEGARLTVCGECAKHGKMCYDEPKQKLVPQKPRTVPIIPRIKTKPLASPVVTSSELREDYGTRIRKAREKLGLSHDELGKKINEKVSLLKKIEMGKMTPDDKLATVLEHVLKVKLIVPAKEEKVPQAKIPRVPSGTLTFGDLVPLEKKREGREKEAERKR